MAAADYKAAALDSTPTVDWVEAVAVAVPSPPVEEPAGRLVLVEAAVEAEAAATAIAWWCRSCHRTWLRNQPELRTWDRKIFVASVNYIPY
jgi:hypothetical protein